MWMLFEVGILFARLIKNPIEQKEEQNENSIG
jgi:Sec-independent protein secretion pathway component TatC